MILKFIPCLINVALLIISIFGRARPTATASYVKLTKLIQQLVTGYHIWETSWKILFLIVGYSPRARKSNPSS